uniref:Uncharacterized protein n=1 Tax=Acrobeloides nanus TaxID=290746 RepID=A0A914CBR4_9BILA
MVSVYLSTLSIIMLVNAAFSLKCYQTNKETGETSIIDDNDFMFCTIFPSVLESNSFTKSVADGLKIDELDKPVEKFFEDNGNLYQLLSICLFEKYDWPKVWNPKFNKGKKAPDVEYNLRCICNTDLCNNPNSFSSHINLLTRNE